MLSGQQSGRVVYCAMMPSVITASGCVAWPARLGQSLSSATRQRAQTWYASSKSVYSFVLACLAVWLPSKHSRGLRLKITA